MAHPIEHAESSVNTWGGKVEDYLPMHNWLDETKSWVCHSTHRMFRHHAEGIFEMEKIFGASFVNSDGQTVYTRYVGEQHVREDCNGYVPTAKEWLNAIESNERPLWMLKTLKIKKKK